MNDKVKKRAQVLSQERPPRLLKNGFGPEIWNPAVPNRFAFPFPSIAKGPIRSVSVRREKGIRGYNRLS